MIFNHSLQVLKNKGITLAALDGGSCAIFWRELVFIKFWLIFQVLCKSIPP